MNISDEKVWESWKSNNQDGYGKAIIDYAEAWADEMEQQMVAGKELESIAKETSHEVDNRSGFGITGFMYSAAVQVLVSCWEHGERLRRWHNLDVQIKNEGEKANATGGVLNTAVLCLEKPD